jgi:3D (Asp-Asp-Asp) domain-containing protein
MKGGIMSSRPEQQGRGALKVATAVAAIGALSVVGIYRHETAPVDPQSHKLNHRVITPIGRISTQACRQVIDPACFELQPTRSDESGFHQIDIFPKQLPTDRKPQPAPTTRPTTPPSTSNRPILWMDSTSYCQGDIMADGQPPYIGAVAVIPGAFPFGTKLKLLSGSYAGRMELVGDHIGWGSQLDIYDPSCQDAVEYGRQEIKVEVIHEPIG